MRVHGVLRLAAATTIALAIVAAPAVARQSSTEARSKTESKSSDPATRHPPASRAPSIQSSPASKQPTIERSPSRNSPSDRMSLPGGDRSIDREALRRPQVERTRTTIRGGNPRTTPRSDRPPAKVNGRALTADDVALTLRLYDLSPVERMRVIRDLEDLLSRQHEATKEHGVDDARRITPPTGTPHPPHVPNNERPVIIPPPDDDDDDAKAPPTTPPNNSTDLNDWDWWVWRWFQMSSAFTGADACWYDPRWLEVSPADRIELSRMYSLGGSTMLRSAGYGHDRALDPHLPIDSNLCIRRLDFGPEWSWSQYVGLLQEREAAEREEERVDCARVTAQRFDGAAASFEVALPALGAETLDELHEAITSRLARGESIPLPVVLKPGDVEDVSVEACKRPD